MQAFSTHESKARPENSDTAEAGGEWTSALCHCVFPVTLPGNSLVPSSWVSPRLWLAALSQQGLTVGQQTLPGSPSLRLLLPGGVLALGDGPQPQARFCSHLIVPTQGLYPPLRAGLAWTSGEWDMQGLSLSERGAFSQPCCLQGTRRLERWWPCPEPVLESPPSAL